MTCHLVVHGLGDAPEIVEVLETDAVASLIEKLRPRHLDLPVDEVAVFALDTDVALATDVILKDAVGDGGHVHIPKHCRRVHATIRFVSAPEPKVGDFPSSWTVGKLRDWAADAFGIVHDQWADYRLKSPGADDYLPNADLLGEVVTREPCELLVDLVRAEHNAGSSE